MHVRKLFSFYFIFQINGLHQSEYQEELDDPKQTSLEMKASKACPEKLTGYEILLDDTSEPEMPKISGKNFPELFVCACLTQCRFFLSVWSLISLDAGIQHAVRVLEHTLKNLLVYRDSKANLDLPQKPYAEREKRVCGHSSALYGAVIIYTK